MSSTALFEYKVPNLSTGSTETRVGEKALLQVGRKKFVFMGQYQNYTNAKNIPEDEKYPTVLVHWKSGSIITLDGVRLDPVNWREQAQKRINELIEREGLDKVKNVMDNAKQINFDLKMVMDTEELWDSIVSVCKGMK